MFEGILAAVFAGQFDDAFGFQFFPAQSDRADDLQCLFVRQQDAHYRGLGFDDDDGSFQKRIQQCLEIGGAGSGELLFHASLQPAAFAREHELRIARPIERDVG